MKIKKEINTSPNLVIRHNELLPNLIKFISKFIAEYIPFGHKNVTQHLNIRELFG